MTLHFSDDHLTVYCGDVRAVLPTLPDASVNCVVTSPPYWGLRDYGTPGQLGLEPTPEEYVADLVAIFREVRRVLRDDGTVWLNLGDSYAGSSQTGGTDPSGLLGYGNSGTRDVTTTFAPSRTTPRGLKPKDLVGIPWRVAFALQADGWYLRSDIVWSKPNPMPESVTDRPTKSHEYVFLLTKSARYYFDADAVREDQSESSIAAYERARTSRRPPTDWKQNKAVAHIGAGPTVSPNAAWSDAAKLDRLLSRGRNLRTVWTIATQPYPGAHFATFPEALVEPCVKAGCPETVATCDCLELIQTPTGTRGGDDPTMETGRKGLNRPRGDDEGRRPITRGEQRAYALQMRGSDHRDEMERECGAAFAHYIRTDRAGARPLPMATLAAFRARGWLHDPEPCSHPRTAGVVLDPFAGSGTTGRVANRLSRRAVLIELNPDYIDQAMARNAQAPLGIA